jgi:hypothetical protein
MYLGFAPSSEVTIMSSNSSNSASQLPSDKTAADRPIANEGRRLLPLDLGIAPLCIQKERGNVGTALAKLIEDVEQAEQALADGWEELRISQ